MPSYFLGKNPITWLLNTLRARGPVHLVAATWHALLDVSWDWFHGTETLTRIPPQNLQTDSPNKILATTYGATRARPLMRLFERLALPRDGGFVDFGSGKGRVIMIAARYGFKRVVGIDFSEPLCQIARKNLEAFRRRRKLTSEVTIVHSDVVDYAIQMDETTFFIFDPFNTEVLNKVLRNLRQSAEEFPRKITLIYNSPRLHDLVNDCKLFTDSRRVWIGGIEFGVYGNSPILLP